MGDRIPAVCGLFYPSGRTKLQENIANLFNRIEFFEKASEAIVPHAGYNYSGRVAAKTIALLEKKERFIILSPNHTGMGCDIALSESDSWITPLGKVKVDKGLSKRLQQKGFADFDESAHIAEHSIEVILPLLQHRFRPIKVVPVTIATTEFEKLVEFGKIIAENAKENDFNVVASSDFSHFVTERSAKEKDLLAIDIIKKISPREFYELATGRNFSICGVSPITVLLQYCKMIGRKKAQLIEYSTSASFSKDYANVVGYAGIVFL
ncbi:MAG: AmmeMemoRadiSam system protein B [Candidatus Diapherotrites archaeon]|nr:AmmeMemoRadiSam system protein B [Candidatus Diapherotrites archaeon]